MNTLKPNVNHTLTPGDNDTGDKDLSVITAQNIMTNIPH